MTTAPAPARFRTRVHAAAAGVRQGLRDRFAVALDRARGGAMKAGTEVQDAKGAVQEKAAAVAHTAARAAATPAEVAREVRKELDAWTRGFAKSAAWGALLAVLALFALTFVSVGVASLLNRGLGAPWGTLLVGLAYVLGAAGAFAALRKTRRETTREVERHAQHAREDVSDLLHGAPREPRGAH